MNILVVELGCPIAPSVVWPWGTKDEPGARPAQPAASRASKKMLTCRISEGRRPHGNTVRIVDVRESSHDFLGCEVDNRNRTVGGVHILILGVERHECEWRSREPVFRSVRENDANV